MKTKLDNDSKLGIGKLEHTGQQQQGLTMTTNWTVINWTLTTNLVNGKMWTIPNLDNDNRGNGGKKICAVPKYWPMKTNLVNENKYGRYRSRNVTKKNLDD